MANTTNIPVENLRTLTRRVAKLASRAASRGMPAPSLAIVREYADWTDVPDGFARLRGETGAMRRVAVGMAEVRVEGGEPMVGGWKVVGHRMAANSRNPVFLSYGDVPEDIRGRPLCCEHCDTSRKRKATFVLRDERDGGAIEVGGSCLAEFTGVPGGTRLLEGLSDVAAIHRLVAEASAPEWADAADRMEECRLVLAVAKRTIAEGGFISSARAKGTGEEPTFRIVARSLELSRSEGAATLDSSVPLASDFIAADEAAAWAISRRDEGDFMHAAAAAVERGIANIGDVALLTAVAHTHAVALARDAERSAQRAAATLSRHVGREGDRIETVVRVRKVVPFESRYGKGTTVLMADGDGNLLAWTTGNAHRMCEGRAYEVKATVGEHRERRFGEEGAAPETKLRRVSVVSDLGPFAEADPRPALSGDDVSALDALFGSDTELDAPNLF